jgi:hypothetical protein
VIWASDALFLGQINLAFLDDEKLENKAESHYICLLVFWKFEEKF